jgi:hypothetical protein
MNTKLFFMAIAVIAAFGIAATAVVGPVTLTTPAVAQNLTDGNVTAGNMTDGNMTGLLTPPS